MTDYMNDGCGWGGSWVMIILFALIFGNGGFGFGGGGASRFATAEDVSNGFNFAALERQNNEIVGEVRQSMYDTTGAVKDASYNNLSELRDLQALVAGGFSAQQKCCCETLRAIDGLNYNGAINTAAINANTTAGIQKIADMLQQNKIETLQGQINALQLREALCGVVRYPTHTTYAVPAPSFGGGCGCNYGVSV